MKCVARKVVRAYKLSTTNEEYMARDKRSKFVELIENRVNRAIKDIRLIGNLANRNAYEYTDEDVKKVFRALNKEIEAARSRFTGDTGGRDSDFRLE
jgi:hypothetical protein